MTDPAIVAYVLADSDRCDRERQLRDIAWRDGYRAAAAQFPDWEARGYIRAIEDVKAAQHEIVTDLRLELARWDGLREHFGRPRPGDYPGTQNLRAGAA